MRDFDMNKFNRRHKFMMTFNKFFIGVVALLVFSGIGFSVYSSTVTEMITVTIQDKERVMQTDSDGNVQSKYLVFTNKETLECSDSLFHFKWNSSDQYGRLKKGETYRIKVAGFRVPFLSMYRNIISVN